MLTAKKPGDWHSRPPRNGPHRAVAAGIRRLLARATGQDLIAGLTVAAVALPLALAFGVASGSTAAAGLVTAIIAGFIIGVLGGASYLVSGPTGAMSAVLIIIAHQYGPRDSGSPG